MKIGVLGTGVVGQSIATKLVSLGHDVKIDLGDITSARGTEMLLPIWLRLFGAFKTPNINFHIARP